MKKTIADYPKLVKEWHYVKNGSLKPFDVASQSHKKIWWQCDKNHEWQAVCYIRTGKDKTDCPYCSNKKVCKDNCLAITHPELAKEWHPTKNGDLTANDIVAGSDKKFWWICNKGHEWQATCNNRTGIYETGCPYCSNQKLCEDNCFAAKNPELVKEWHPTLNGNLTPNDVVAGSNKKFWWICNKNHEWQTSTNARISKKTGCPYCSNQKVCKDNCLSTTHPELAKEWHPTLNGNLTPNNVTAGSGKKYWWLCEKNHKWEAICFNRSREDKKRGCPVCNESKGEKEVVRILKKLNVQYKREYRFNSCKNINPLPFDFVIWSNNKVKIIEYHGIQHYEPRNFGSNNICKHESFKEIQYRDKIKKEWCLNKLILFLEISYKDYDKIEEKIVSFLLN